MILENKDKWLKKSKNDLLAVIIALNDAKLRLQKENDNLQSIIMGDPKDRFWVIYTAKETNWTTTTELTLDQIKVGFAEGRIKEVNLIRKLK